MNTVRVRAAVPALVAVAAAVLVAGVLFFRGNGPGAATEEAGPRPPATLLASARHGSVPGVRLTPAERQALGIETTAVQSSSRPQTVRMPATTALDPDALAHVHPRFAGEAVTVKAGLGAHVHKGDPLAVLWSKDLGEKKSELMDARSLLALNKDVLEHTRAAYQMGDIPENVLRQAERDYEASRIAADRAYHTLLSWRLTKKEIDNIGKASEADWPRVVVEAPITGTVVEKNVVPGELVDPTVNLFVLADLSRLAVWAYAYEDALLKLHVGDPWSVTLAARPGAVLHGQIRVIGAVVDPTQHTATIQGTIPNRDETLRAGMFATATVSLPPDPDQVVVPTAALVDASDHTFVYVQSPRQPDEFRRREVQVRERLASETLLTAGVKPGDEVVSRGALELDARAQAEP
jgi:cobalt-zinc-cadmium efflux system membrane fusion protein